MKSLYDMLLEHDMSLDVYDEVYDSGVCWDMIMPESEARVVLGDGVTWSLPDEDEDRDDQDRVMEVMARSIQAGKDYGSSATAFIATYVKDNVGTWSRFAEEFNNEYFQIKGDDEDSIYNGIKTIEALVIGNYGDDAYEWLLENLPAPEEADL